ncbi:META domain-containing protein [Pontibacter ruber]|uniref:META domain-containing protein n=1 Tax=Pontibacter ruber TaxID=1343895 RepID=A0ABW5CUM4_9BACT|nr:META domain-containing protein [Pontibacter ruber]
MKKLVLYLLLLPLLAMFSCLDKEQDDVPAPPGLFDRWNLVVIGYKDKADLSPPEDAHVWIAFEKQAGPAGSYRFNGQAAPNNYFGSFNLVSEGGTGTMLFGELSTTEVASTKMANTQFEVEYFSLLPKAKSYTIQQNTLIILCSDGEKLVYNRQSD